MMKIQNDLRYRINVIQEILKNGKKFPMQLAHMNDDFAWEFLKSYYPYEAFSVYLRLGGKLARKQRENLK